MLGTALIVSVTVGIPAALLAGFLITTLRTRRAMAHERALEVSGSPAPAAVLAVHDGMITTAYAGARAKKDIRLVLEVRPPGEEPFRASGMIRQVGASLSVRPGQRVLVRYDRNDSSVVAVDADTFRAVAEVAGMAAHEAEERRAREALALLDELEDRGSR